MGGRELTRIKETFTAYILRGELLRSDNIRFEVPPDIGDLQEAIHSCGARLRQHKYTLAKTGKYFVRSIVGEIIAYLLGQRLADRNPVCLLLDGVGSGKTVVMRDVLCTLEEAGIPTLAIKADLQISGLSGFNALQDALHLPMKLEAVVARLAALGPVVVLIDQIDALSLSMASDETALDIALELVARLRLIPGVQLLLSCRTFDRNSNPSLRLIEVAREFSLVPLSNEETTEALEIITMRLDDLMPATRQLLRSPLHLDLFLRVIERRNSADRILVAQGLTTLQSLYNQWCGFAKES